MFFGIAVWRRMACDVVVLKARRKPTVKCQTKRWKDFNLGLKQPVHNILYWVIQNWLFLNFFPRLIKHKHEDVRENGDMAPSILYFDNIWRWVVGFMPQPIKFREKNPWYNEKQVGWAPELVWTTRRREKPLALLGNKPWLCGVPSRDLVAISFTPKSNSYGGGYADVWISHCQYEVRPRHKKRISLVIRRYDLICRVSLERANYCRARRLLAWYVVIF
jgi:hypothetical protein